MPNSGNLQKMHNLQSSPQMHSSKFETESDTLKSVNKKSLKEVWRQFLYELFNPILIIVRVTVVFTCVLLADTFIIFLINWSFGSSINYFPFVRALFEGIQLLSALGTAISYILYLIPSLIKDTKHVIKEVFEETK